MKSTELINAVVEDGFFSEYLPSTFCIKGIDNLLKIDLASPTDFVEPLIFSMSRFSGNGSRRTIYVPEFSSYLAVIKYMKNEKILEDLIRISDDSHSFSPIIQKDGELTRHEIDYNVFLSNGIEQEGVASTYISNIVEKIHRARGAKGILSLDIANFYSSIYTHLLPSIKLGYQEAERQYKAKKANNTDPSISEDYRKYAKLDELIRNINVGRSNGLLPGTMLSQILAEALLSRIDKEIEEKKIQFTRYVDDYEIFIYDDREIARIENEIAVVLKKYFLSLNTEKTVYTKFPYYVADDLDSFINAYIQTDKMTSNIIGLFNYYFKLEKNGIKGAIRYLVKSLNTEMLPKSRSDASLIVSYLISILSNDTRSLVKVCEKIISLKRKLKTTSIDIGIIESQLKLHIEAGNDLEAIWLLFLRKRLSYKCIPARISHLIAKSTNDLAKIVLLEEYDKKLSDSIKNEIIDSASTWLLSYQLFFHDYIDKSTFQEKSKIMRNLSFYSQLKRNGFSFYRKR